MSRIKFAVAAALVSMAAVSGQASAGPNCHTGGARYGAPKVATVPAPRAVQASIPVKPQIKVATPVNGEQSGGEGDGKPTLRKAQAEPRVDSAPVVQQQAAVEKPATSDESADYTPVSAVAARLAALAAQQAASARNNAATGQ